MSWEQVGMIGVDAGLCWIGDPCYCVTPDATEHPAETWSEFCDTLFEEPKFAGHFPTLPKTRQWNYKKGHAGLGVSVETGYGDGTYPVFVKYNDEGRVAEVRVVFINENEESDQ